MPVSAEINPLNSACSIVRGPSEFLAFTLDQEEYGIDIQKVQELRGYEHLA
jgi:purine-binding chemotaxis protein CheW